MPGPLIYKNMYKELLTPRTSPADGYYVWYNNGTQSYYKEAEKYYLAPTQFEVNQKHAEFDKEASSGKSKILHPSYRKTRIEELNIQEENHLL